MNPRLIGVRIFLERRTTRMYVGCLIKEKDQFVFTYDDLYFRARKIISLGPEFPMTRKVFTSKNLFPSLKDRIPSKENPAYSEYCSYVGISPDEDNPFVLLSTIGQKGPSSFVFMPLYEREFQVQDVIEFRKLLGFTTRDFAEIFEIPQASLNALERRRNSGKDLLKRLELIVRFPDVALYLLLVNGGVLPDEKYLYAEKILKSSV